MKNIILCCMMIGVSCIKPPQEQESYCNVTSLRHRQLLPYTHRVIIQFSYQSNLPVRLIHIENWNSADEQKIYQRVLPKGCFDYCDTFTFSRAFNASLLVQIDKGIIPLGFFDVEEHIFREYDLPNLLTLQRQFERRFFFSTPVIWEESMILYNLQGVKIAHVPYTIDPVSAMVSVYVEGYCGKYHLCWRDDCFLVVV